MCGTLEESGVTSGGTVELKFRGRGGGPEPQTTNSLEVEIEPKPPGMERLSSAGASSASGATKMMRGYDRDGNGLFSRDEVREMATDFLKEKQTRRLTTKVAIVIGVILLLVVAMNAGLTAAIVFLSKDIKVADGKLLDPKTNEELRFSSAETMVSAEGELVDRKHGTTLKTAESEQVLALDSRLPDSAWAELRHATFKTQEGGLLHVQVQVRCVPHFPCKATHKAEELALFCLAGRLPCDRRARVARLVRQNSYERWHNHTRWLDSHLHRRHGGRVQECGLRSRAQAAAATGRV